MVMFVRTRGYHNGECLGQSAACYESVGSLPARYRKDTKVKVKRSRKPAEPGSNRGNSKMDAMKVLVIRKMAETFTNPQIAAHFDLAVASVQAIVSKRNWGWVTASHDGVEIPVRLKNQPLKKRGPTATKINKNKVLLVRRDYARGGVSLADVAKRYGISRTYAQCIIKRTKWQHV